MTAVVLGPADRGRSVPVRPGDRIVLRLPENPTTGYRWTADAPPPLRRVADRNEPPPRAGDAPGAASVRVLEFEADDAGRARLSLACVRDWDSSASPTDTFEVVIEVA